MTGTMDEAALWERVAPKKGAPTLVGQLRELLGEALCRKQEYRRLGLNFTGDEVETLRGLVYYYSGERPKVSWRSLEHLGYLPSLRRLMELEIQARGRYYALCEELADPERALLQTLAEDAETRWRKLLRLTGKA